jgi:hypothetical protein
VTKEADLPAIKAAVERHNTPFDPALVKTREIKDVQTNTITIATGGDQVREPFISSESAQQNDQLNPSGSSHAGPSLLALRAMLPRALPSCPVPFWSSWATVSSG